MSILVTGVAGFIGSNLAVTLIEQGHTVFGVDNFSLGSEKNLTSIRMNTRFHFRKTEMTDLTVYKRVVTDFCLQEQITEVWHLAANSDIQSGVLNPSVDLRNTFMTTFNTLEIMKEHDIPKLLFASSSAIYGDLGARTLTEDIGPLLPISNYGAMKLASEAAISASTESWLDSAYIFRFPNVIGVPATHGVLLDFIRKLNSNPYRLDVLGDGTQQKSYLHVEELINAMMFIKEHSRDKISFYNIGPTDDGVSVRFIAQEAVRIVSPGAKLIFGQGAKGWVGDVPKFFYSVEKLKRLGWTPKFSSRDAVRRALCQIHAQETTRP